MRHENAFPPTRKSPIISPDFESGAVSDLSPRMSSGIVKETEAVFHVAFKSALRPHQLDQPRICVGWEVF